MDGSNTISPSLQYGYRIKLLEELKVELSSYIGSPNSYLQISLITPKFRAGIPILAKAEMLRLEIFKLSVFVTFYLGIEMYAFLSKRSERRRKRVEFDNYNRLSVEKTAVAKSNSDYSYIALDSIEKEDRNNGLIILLAYIGSKKAIKSVEKKIMSKINRKSETYEALIEKIS